MEFNYVPEPRKLHKKNRPPKSIKAVLIFLGVIIGMMAFSQILVLYTKTAAHAPKTQAVTANANARAEIAAINKKLVEQKSIFESHINAFMAGAAGEETMIEVNEAYSSNLNVLIDQIRAIVPGTEAVKNARSASLNAMLIEQANTRSIRDFVETRKAKHIKEFNNTRIASVAEIKESQRLLK